jgi:NADPH:quinone reductase-like Zn-dependent oxidoreductase
MRAVVHDRYGPPEVLRIEDVEPPTPAPDELLVRVHASTVSQTDCHMRRAQPFVWRFLLGLRRPRRRVLGLEFAGLVEAVGGEVTAFAVGDRVFGLRSGAHAEYICVREAGLMAQIPAGTTFEGAAAVCDGVSQARGHLAAGGVGAGTRLLVYGASGSCGTAAVQLGRYLGAHVTAVCTTANFELMRTLGADELIDYTLEDFTRSGERYDVILDAVGKHSFFRARRSLVPHGRFVPTDGVINVPLALATRWLGDKRVVAARPGYSREDVLLVKTLIEEGRFRPVVDRTYPMEDVVEASRYVESWQKTGNVVLTI